MSRIVFVGAHPDDIEIGCAGLLNRIKDSDEIKFIICSEGENGGEPFIRSGEVLKSSGYFNTEICQFDFPDGEIPVNNDSVSNVQKAILNFHPDTVFTHFPEDTHQDHRAVSKIVQSICYRKNIDLIYFDSYSSVNFIPNMYAKIDWEEKSKVLEIFESQLKKSDIWERCKIKSMNHGYNSGCENAEGFVVDRIKFFNY